MRYNQFCVEGVHVDISTQEQERVNISFMDFGNLGKIQFIFLMLDIPKG